MAARRIYRASVLLSAVLFLSCSDSPTETEQIRAPAALDIVAGDAQEGVVGVELASPLVVRVEDANGLPVIGQLVNFRVTSGGGSVFAGSGITNALGIVQDRWTLGTSTADSQRVEARAVDPNTGARIVFATFRATARPGPAQSVTKTGGDAQQGPLGVALAESLAVRVADTFDNPVPGVTVAWAAALSNDAVTPATSQSNAQGVAKARWTLGARLDIPHSVTATAGALAPAAFTANATLPSNATIVNVVGHGASVVVGTVMAESLAVRVQLASGQPVAGATVTWTPGGGGSISPATSVTQADGIARTRLTLGTAAGPQPVTASVPNLTALALTITGTPDVPAALAKIGGDGQTGVVGEALAQQIAVRVTDRYGNRVPNVNVGWTVATGAVVPGGVVTNLDGEATAQWTLGPASGSQTAAASASNGPSVEFGATALRGPVASIVVIGGDGQSGTASSVLPNRVEVRVMDRFGNPASDVAISFTGSDGAQFSPPNAFTDAAGRVSSIWRLGGLAGTQTATIGDGTISATATATATTGTAGLVTIVSGNAQAGIAGDPLASPLVVRVTDANGNPVAGVPVSWAAGSSCGSIASPSTISDASGITQTTWTLGLSGRTCISGVTASIAAGASAQFTARFLGRTAQIIDPGNFVEQVATIDVPVVLGATVTDGAENPVPNVTVTWSRTEGNGSLATTSSVTDSFGRASATFTPGTIAGNNRVSASVSGVNAVEYLVWTRALAPERIVVAGGNNQIGEPGQSLAQLIQVRVEDRYGNGVYDEPVTFQVTNGGGHVERTTLRTDPLGVASTFWAVGSVGAQEVRATWNATTVLFAATGVEGTREGLIIVGGNEQVATTSMQTNYGLAPLTVRVVNGRGEPVSGVPVTWAVDAQRIVGSDASGLSTLTGGVVFLGGVGTPTRTATLPNGTVVRFTLIVQSGGGGAFGSPAHTGVAGARVGRRLPGRVIVRCLDRMGGPSGCSLSVQGQTIPAPGIFPAGHSEYFWIMPAQPGAYSFTVFGGAGPNQITATAVP